MLIHALRCLPFAEALVMVECAVGRGDMTLGFLRDRLPGKRNGRARQVLDWVDRGAESMLETLARTYFRQAGISVETQVYIDGVGYVDLLLEGTLIVELDGRHHGEWAQVKKDQRRNNVSVVRGYSVLRYYYDDVVHHPALMLAEVLAVLGRVPGWRRRHGRQVLGSLEQRIPRNDGLRRGRWTQKTARRDARRTAAEAAACAG